MTRFSLDNTRATLSDQPGEDDLTLKAGRLNWQSMLLGLDSTLQLSHASTDTTYSYDEDWSYVGIAPGLGVQLLRRISARPLNEQSLNGDCRRRRPMAQNG
jgi:hypothetical protein